MPFKLAIENHLGSLALKIRDSSRPTSVLFATVLAGCDRVSLLKQAGKASMRAGASLTNETTEQLPLLRPDPSVLNESVPIFFIGRNRQGLWVARDAEGQSGGVFLFKNSALRFARASTWPTKCATIFLLERFELDIENKGNPLAAHLGVTKDFLTHALSQLFSI